MAQVIEGKKIAKARQDRLKGKLEKAINEDSSKTKSCLVSIYFGSNSSTVLYANTQKKLCDDLGIEYIPKPLPENASISDINAAIDECNASKGVTGIIVQLPLPANVSHEQVTKRIKSEKDVEGLNPKSVSRFLSGDYSITPCTPAAVMALLEDTKQKLQGKEAVIINHSKIVGRPLCWMLLDKLVTVTICHIGTSKASLEDHIKKADILVSAVGVEGFQIPGAWVKKNAIVIDAAIKWSNGKITGDVDFDSAAQQASYITPVPGGVGPVTNIILLENLYELYKAQGTTKYT